MTYTYADVQNFRKKNHETLVKFYTEFENRTETTWLDYQVGEGVTSLKLYSEDRRKNAVLRMLGKVAYPSKISPEENLEQLALLIILKMEAPLRKINLPSEYEGIRILYRCEPQAKLC